MIRWRVVNVSPPASATRQTLASSSQRAPSTWFTGCDGARRTGDVVGVLLDLRAVENSRDQFGFGSNQYE